MTASLKTRNVVTMSAHDRERIAISDDEKVSAGDEINHRLTVLERVGHQPKAQGGRADHDCGSVLRSARRSWCCRALISKRRTTCAG
jgi:hypothetical protein